MNGNTAGKTPRTALEEALEVLLGCRGQIDAESPQHWACECESQERQLFDWARETGRLKPESELLPITKLGGAEHRVKYRGEAQRWTKNTHPGTYGLYAYVEHTLDKETQHFMTRLEYGRALPSQYLERLCFANRVFGDDIQVNAIIETRDGISIETTQPDVDGKAPDEEAVTAFMAASRFVRVPGGGPTWYRALDDLLVIDASTWNFIETEDGDVIPFDVGLQQPIGELKEYIIQQMPE